jgi:hypothetical protein
MFGRLFFLRCERTMASYTATKMWDEALKFCDEKNLAVSVKS